MKKISELKLDEVMKQIDERIIHSREMHKVTVVAMEVLKKLDGKRITKRFGQKVQEALPDYRVYYDTNYHMYHISIRSIRKVVNNHWDEGLLNVNSGYVNLLIGYQSEGGYYNHEKGLEHATGYLRCKEDADRLEEMKKDMPDTIERWNVGINDLKEARKIVHAEEITFMDTIFTLMPR